MMYRLAIATLRITTLWSLIIPSLAASSNVGVRWYEIRNPNAATPTLFQQGTFAPDSNFRWMAALAWIK